MPLTRSFQETVKARASLDEAFRRGLLTEALDCFLSGEVDEGKLVLRDYVNATIGFQELGNLTGHTPKSLMRMLSHDGNPRADNLFVIIKQLQLKEGIQIKASVA